MNRKSSLAFATTKYFSSLSGSDLLFKCNALRAVEIQQLITKLPQNNSDFTTMSLNVLAFVRRPVNYVIIIDAFLCQFCTINCKTTRFSYNQQDDTEKHIRLVAFRFTNRSLGGLGDALVLCY